MDQQMSLFGHDPGVQCPAVRTFQGAGADVTFYENFFKGEDCDRWFHQLDQETQWRQDHLQIFNRTIPLPRQTAWYGDPGKTYTYSGIEMSPTPWTDTLLEIKAQVEPAAGPPFNGVLLNQYRHGQDSMAWHSDDEAELGKNPAIASVSLGATRQFRLKHKFDRSVAPIAIPLTHGSLLLMAGATQHFWVHQVPKTTKPVGVRINLTFRYCGIFP
jgi:alkylated DNA repair dioxygenase AlkB